MSEPEPPPRIEFPCDYPVKVLGRSVPEFRLRILQVFDLHAPGFDHALITTNTSSKGTFNSMTVVITATGEPQLKALHLDLLDTGLVQMVI
jgi:putative lipoic acid-binding regulatory protein